MKFRKRKRKPNPLEQDHKSVLYWQAWDIPGGHVSVMIKSDKKDIEWPLHTIGCLQEGAIKAQKAIDEMNTGNQ